jgi:hypothetical protein
VLAMTLTMRDVAYVATRGWMEGTGETLFEPDAEHIGFWTKDAVNTLTKAGLIKGMEDHRFAPKKSATRAEVAALIARFARGFIR